MRSRGTSIKRAGFSLLILLALSLCLFQRAVSNGHRSLRALSTVQGLEEKAPFFQPDLNNTPQPGGYDGGNVLLETLMPSPEATVPPPTPEPTGTVASLEPTPEPSPIETLEPTASSDLHQSEVTNAIDILRGGPAMKGDRDERHEESLQKADLIRQEILATGNNAATNTTMFLAKEAEDEDKNLSPCDQIISVEWLPPTNASQDDIYVWVGAVAKSLDQIRASDLGGDPLRSLGKDEMEKLDALRNELFCGHGE